MNNNPEGLVLSNSHNAAVAAIVHPRGTNYWFVETDMRVWSWWEMVAQLHEASLRYVVEDGDETRGLVGCEFRKRTGSYDHSRQVQGLANPAQLLCWDFVLKRSDGTAVRLHPEWSNPKVSTYAVDGAWGNPDPSQRLGDA